MITEAVSFKRWVVLNEMAKERLEVYTKFKNVKRNELLRITPTGVYPSSSSIVLHSKISVKKVFDEYLSGFEIARVNPARDEYVVTGSEFKDEEGNDLVLNFDEVRSSDYTSAISKIDFFGFVQKLSKKKIESGQGFSEYVMLPEFNSIPEQALLPAILERAKTTWLNGIDPNDFSSDLESILFSRSVGGSFFNRKELEDFLSKILIYVIVEKYIEAVLDSFEVQRTTIDLDELELDLDSKLNKFVKNLKSNGLTEEEAKNMLDFIKYLTFTLRPKGSTVKEKADSVLADLMTEVQRAGMTKKLMDLL